MKTKIKNFIKDRTKKVLSAFSTNNTFHKYKYCTTVNIHNDVSSVLKNRRNSDMATVKVLQKI